MLVFWEDKIELLHRGELQAHWLYTDLQKLVFHAHKANAGFLSLFLGSMGKKLEDEWLIISPEGKHLFQLEIDSKYRKNELQQLCAYLSREVAVFEQQTLP